MKKEIIRRLGRFVYSNHYEEPFSNFYPNNYLTYTDGRYVYEAKRIIWRIYFIYNILKKKRTREWRNR